MDGKIRFDLKQISAWDKQNENDMKKKGAEASKPKGKSSFFKKDPNAEEGDGTGFDHGYRDRALERRKETPAEDAQMEEIVSKLDAEQTKFLGGDMEHTHLVKGLDYALLDKVRRQKEKEDALNASASAVKAQSDIVPLHQIQPTSQIGTSMLRFLTKQQSQTQAVPGTNKGSQNAGLTVAGSILQRTVFEFDTAPQSEVDVPLMVTRSRKEFTTNEEYVNFVMNTDMFTQLCGLMETGKLLTAKQKKKRALKESSEAPTSSTAPSITVPSSSANSNKAAVAPIMSRIVDDDDIYGDDLVVGKYVPAGLDDTVSAMDTAPATTSTDNGALYASSATDSAMVKNIFTSSSTTTACVNNDLMKPIRDLLGAQQAKEQALKQRQQAHIQTQLHGTNNTTTATGKSMVVGTDSSGKSLVHRDVFATTKDKVVQGNTATSGSGKLGEVFGLHGGYDLFPETTGSYEQYDSDDAEGAEGVGDEPAAKKHKPSSSSGGAAAPSGKSSSSGGGGGGAGGGTNRAARRAGAK